ncbi:neuron navigator 3-like protein [Labeo rohita]|uniref:Neuron navigator 3-like protein n=1 Tax=Labeo rohita TaxID=84645 RepID=A0A498NAI6_LABRO|nr:neuron navigator 3-like protein [Labeo rohita]
MSVSKVAAEKGKEAPSRSCPAACGFMISGRDSHPMCIACMGVKHAQAALADTESCSHCRVMPARVLEQRLRVAASSKDDPVLSAVPSSTKGAHPSPLRDTPSWGDIMDSESPEFTPLFDQQLLAEGDEVEGDEEEDKEMLARLLREEPDDEEDDAILSAAQASRPVSALSGDMASTVGDCDLVEVCKRAAAKLDIPWPVTPGDPGDPGVKRDIYDGKRLPSRLPPAKQLLPALPACIAEMKRSWDKPFSHRVPVKGYSSLDVTYQAELLEELGTQLDAGNPNPTVWEEICNITDLNLCTSRGVVQSCGRTMALSVAGERSLWLNLSSIGDREKLDFLDAPVDSSGLFGPAVAAMRQRCDLQKKEGEAFDICLLCKRASRPPVPPRPVPPTQNRRFLNAPRTAKTPSTEQSARPPAAPNVKPWGKQSFAAAAAKSKSVNPSSKKRRDT